MALVVGSIVNLQPMIIVEHLPIAFDRSSLKPAVQGCVARWGPGFEEEGVGIVVDVGRMQACFAASTISA